MSHAPAAEPRAMRTRPAPDCPVCGRAGEPLYDELRDRLFGAPGTWRMARCPDPECGLLWLDPMPLPEDLGLAYANYYTHTDATKTRGPVGRALKRWAIEGFYSARYGYSVRGGFAKRWLTRAAVRTPELREYLDSLILKQPPRPGGRALDVGCGDGRTVEMLASLGWKAEGVDFDPGAVRQAQARGLEVRAGTLEAQSYPSSHFDVIGMSHVLEHVPDPLATLRECRRLLAPGGQLVLATPNARSLGHQRFGRDWRGLETPRHLHVFSAGALRRTVQRSGLAEVSLEGPTRGAAFAHAESRRIQGDANARPGDASAIAFAREERAAAASDPWAGEELLLVATVS